MALISCSLWISIDLWSSLKMKSDLILKTVSVPYPIVYCNQIQSEINFVNMGLLYYLDLQLLVRIKS